MAKQKKLTLGHKRILHAIKHGYVNPNDDEEIISFMISKAGGPAYEPKFRVYLADLRKSGRLQKTQPRK